MARAPAPSFARARTTGWCAHRSATRSTDGRSVKSKGARGCCRLTAALRPSRSSAVIAEEPRLPVEQCQQANRKACSDRVRRSKLHCRPLLHKLVSQKSVAGPENKSGIMPRGHSVTHAEKPHAVCKMVLALPHILLRAP